MVSIIPYKEAWTSTQPNMRKLGFDPRHFWMEHKPYSQLSFRANAQDDGGGFRVGRLYLPPTITELRATVDRTILGVYDNGDAYPGAITNNIATTPRGAYDKALVALVTANSTLMETAKSELLADNPGVIWGFAASRELWPAVLALDWCTWDDSDQFNTAFAVVKGHWDSERASENRWGYSYSSYFDNNVHWDWTQDDLLLALVCEGQPGAAGTHAAGRWATFDNLDPTEVTKPLISPYLLKQATETFCPGGQQAGTGDSATVMFGGYEYYFTLGDIATCWAFETATGEPLFTNNLYFQTRAKTAALELDATVEYRDAHSAEGSTLMEVLSRKFDDGVATWCLDNSPGWETSRDRMLFYSCLAGPSAAASQTPETIGMSSGQWHWRDSSQSAPADDVQVRIVFPRLEHARKVPDSRGFGYRHGTVGLVQGHNWRGHVRATRGNGVVIGTAIVDVTGATQANPVVITATAHGFSNNDNICLRDLGGMTELNERNFIVTNATADTFELYAEDGTGHTAYTSGGTVSDWDLTGPTTYPTYQYQPFYSSDATVWPDIVASSSTYYQEVGISQPEFRNGKYEWTEDWTYRFENAGALNTDINGKVTLAETTWSFTPSTGVLVIEDDIQCDTDLAVQWRFSCSHVPNISGLNMDWTNAGDRIDVDLQVLDGSTTFKTAVVRSTATDMDINYPSGRIQRQVIYEPVTRLSTHQIRTTITPS